MGNLKQVLLIVVSGLFLLNLGCSMLEPATATAASEMKVVYPRCEYLENPLGIETARPRFSWLLESKVRGQKQTAYQILVASSEANLNKDKGDLWDTGKITSDQISQVVYAGKPLRSRMQCWWKVRSWDKDGNETAWSKPALWTMGLLQPSDWQAKWIGYDAPTPKSHQLDSEEKTIRLDDCSWVWFPEGDPRKEAPAGTRYFRRVFQVADKQVKHAQLVLAVDNELELFVNGQRIWQAAGWKPPKIIHLIERMPAGRNVVAIAAKNSGKDPAGLTGKMVIEYEDGAEQVIKIDPSWKASQRGPSGWNTVKFDDNDWKAAKVIAKVGDQPWGSVDDEKLHVPPPPYLRKEFAAAKSIKRATVYASALGIYDLHINSQRIGNDYFTPGWTEYKKRVYYQAYDVTKLVQKGNNAMGAVLADGWYSGYIGWGRKRDHYGDKPRLMVQLELEFTDGSKQTIVTDSTWKAKYGPHLEADFLMGEAYDARMAMPDWSKAGFNDGNWQNVAVTDKVKIPVQRHPGVTVQETDEVKAVKITEPKEGHYVFDLGQNFAGIVRLKIKGKEGQKVNLRFVEVLNPDGTIYTENLRGARAMDTYICKSGKEEVWQPRLTFHGFRYVEVTGLDKKPDLEMITGVVLNSNTPQAGEFTCSNSMVNQLYRNIVWTQRANFIEVPTDCPQRDERLGWTGDAQIFVRSSTYNMDVASFFTKWLVDLEDAQGAEGDFPDVAPRIVATGGGTAAWGDAGVICPWTIYYTYNDTRVIEKHYEAMAKWIAYLKKNSKNLLRPAKGYGDWVSIGSNTPKDVIATAYFAYSTRLLAKMAAVIGKTQDARKYEALFQDIKKAFNDAYVAEDGRIKGNTQTCYLLGLKFDLLSPKNRVKAAQYLVKDVKGHQWHLTTGFVGLSYLLPMLTETGYPDVAYRLLNNDTFPSWGYSIKNGATSIWERWDGWTEEKGFQTPGMNSFAHYSFGSVCEWMFYTMAGIDTDGPGYKKIIIKPQPGGDMNYTKASYNSINGLIGSDWRIVKRKFHLQVSVPVNTTATVYVPTNLTDSVREGGNPATSAPGVKFLRYENRQAVYQVASGDYYFTADYK
jgi:alpha-L-rhamnosidase